MITEEIKAQAELEKAQARLKAVSQWPQTDMFEKDDIIRITRGERHSDVIAIKGNDFWYVTGRSGTIGYGTLLATYAMPGYTFQYLAAGDWWSGPETRGRLS